MVEEPVTRESDDIVRADELQTPPRPSRFGRRLLALTFVGVVAAYIATTRPWESESMDDPVMPEDQADFVRGTNDYMHWLTKKRKQSSNLFDETVLAREAAYSGERRVDGWIGMVLRHHESDDQNGCSVDSGWVLNLISDPDHPFEMPDLGDWVRFNGTLSHKFTRDPDDYMYSFVAVDDLEVIRAGSFTPMTRERYEKMEKEKLNELRRQLLQSSR